MLVPYVKELKADRLQQWTQLNTYVKNCIKLSTHLPVCSKSSKHEQISSKKTCSKNLSILSKLNIHEIPDLSHWYLAVQNSKLFLRQAKLNYKHGFCHEREMTDQLAIMNGISLWYVDPCLNKRKTLNREDYNPLVLSNCRIIFTQLKRLINMVGINKPSVSAMHSSHCRLSQQTTCASHTLLDQ